MECLSLAGDIEVGISRQGSGAPLLYLHGYEGHPGDASFLAQLARTRDVIAPEHPGYGSSASIDRFDDIVDVALHYRKLIQATAGGPVDVIGHSLGGMFAAELAALSPHLVRKLVLVAPFGLWLEDQQVPDLFAMSPNSLARLTWANPEGHAAQAAMTRSANGSSGAAAIITRTMNLSAAGKFLWPIPDRGTSRRLQYVEAPALVLTGAADRLIPPVYGEAWARSIAGARAEVIADAGHFPMLEQPEAFIAATERFLG